MGRRYGLEGRIRQLHLNMEVCAGEEQLNLGNLLLQWVAVTCSSGGFMAKSMSLSHSSPFFSPTAHLTSSKVSSKLTLGQEKQSLRV